MDAKGAPSLSGPADGSLPTKQEKVAAAQSAPVRQKNPVDRLLDGVPDAYTSKLDRSAMRTLFREHARSSLINPNLNAAADLARQHPNSRSPDGAVLFVCERLPL